MKLFLRKFNSPTIAGLGIALLLALTEQSAFAAMPWETPLEQLRSSLEGPTAKLIITIAIIGAGLAFCVGESGGFFRKAAGVVFGAAIALGASTFVATLFP